MSQAFLNDIEVPLWIVAFFLAASFLIFFICPLVHVLWMNWVHFLATKVPDGFVSTPDEPEEPETT